MNPGSREDYLNIFKEAAKCGQSFIWMGYEVFITSSEINYLAEHLANYTYKLSDGNTVEFKCHKA